MVLLATACSLYTPIAFANYSQSIWDVLRREFSLNHEVRRAEVKKQINWLVSHPTYLKRLAQSEPYMYHILSEVRKRQLPGEVALIPIIESAYNPFAHSGAGAAGLWQIMPKTGQGLGLKQDWWHDSRRSISQSTSAALDYLTYLRKYFKGNWLLAIAAYDSGEGTVSKLIKRSGNRKKPDFWKLPLPRETKGYIPRLLALAAIIENPKKYHVTLPEIPHKPYFEEVNIGSQIDLSHAAKLAGISYKDLIQLNPEYNRWATSPYHPHKILLPKSSIKQFCNKLSELPAEQRVKWRKHKVTEGESLILIAKRNHTTVKMIKELNQLKSNQVQSGQILLMPDKAAAPLPKVTDQGKLTKDEAKTEPAQQPYFKVVHVVQKKDTYEKLEKKYGVTEKQIKSWNFIGPHVPLNPGQNLLIWKQREKNNASTYIVSKGDSLSSIAHQHHLKVSRLRSLNPSIKKDLIKPGQKIALK